MERAEAQRSHLGPFPVLGADLRPLKINRALGTFMQCLQGVVWLQAPPAGPAEAVISNNLQTFTEHLLSCPGAKLCFCAFCPDTGPPPVSTASPREEGSLPWIHRDQWLGWIRTWDWVSRPQSPAPGATRPSTPGASLRPSPSPILVTVNAHWTLSDCTSWAAS